MLMRTPRNFFAHAIAALGGLIVLTELLRHWLRGHEIEGSVIAIGFTIAFVGAYMADRKGAIEGGAFIVDSAVKLGGVFRIGGRRSTDTRVVVQKDIVTTPAAVPAPVPDLAHIPAPEKGE